MGDIYADLLRRLEEDIQAANAAAEDAGATWGTYYTDSDQYREVKSDSGCVIVPNADGWPTAAVADHIRRWDPQRVLDEMTARRELLEILAQLGPDGDRALRTLVRPETPLTYDR